MGICTGQTSNEFPAFANTRTLGANYKHTSMLDKDLLKTLQRLKDLQKPALELQKIISSMEPLTSIMKQVDSMHGEMMKSFNELKNNPEFNFIRIVDNRILTEKQIADSILIIDNNLEKPCRCRTRKRAAR